VFVCSTATVLARCGRQVVSVATAQRGPAGAWASTSWQEEKNARCVYTRRQR